MTAREGPGWLTTLADLALILFMVTTAQLAQAEAARAEANEQSADGEGQMPTVSEAPLDIFRPTPSAQGLGEWLAARPPDPRERLTIQISHGESDRDTLLAAGLTLANEAVQAGWQPRLVMQRGEQSDVSAMIGFDRADEPNNQ